MVIDLTEYCQMVNPIVQNVVMKCDRVAASVVGHLKETMINPRR